MDSRRTEFRVGSEVTDPTYGIGRVIRLTTAGAIVSSVVVLFYKIAKEYEFTREGVFNLNELRVVGSIDTLAQVGNTVVNTVKEIAEGLTKPGTAVAKETLTWRQLASQLQGMRFRENGQLYNIVQKRLMSVVARYENTKILPRLETITDPDLLMEVLNPLFPEDWAKDILLKALSGKKKLPVGIQIVDRPGTSQINKQLYAKSETRRVSLGHRLEESVKLKEYAGVKAGVGQPAEVASAFSPPRIGKPVVIEPPQPIKVTSQQLQPRTIQHTIARLDDAHNPFDKTKVTGKVYEAMEAKVARRKSAADLLRDLVASDKSGEEQTVENVIGRMFGGDKHYQDLSKYYHDLLTHDHTGAYIGTNYDTKGSIEVFNRLVSYHGQHTEDIVSLRARKSNVTTAKLTIREEMELARMEAVESVLRNKNLISKLVQPGADVYSVLNIAIPSFSEDPKVMSLLGMNMFIPEDIRLSFQQINDKFRPTTSTTSHGNVIGLYGDTQTYTESIVKRDLRIETERVLASINPNLLTEANREEFLYGNFINMNLSKYGIESPTDIEPFINQLPERQAGSIGKLYLSTKGRKGYSSQYQQHMANRVHLVGGAGGVEVNDKKRLELTNSINDLSDQFLTTIEADKRGIEYERLLANLPEDEKSKETNRERIEQLVEENRKLKIKATSELAGPNSFKGVYGPTQKKIAENEREIRRLEKINLALNRSRWSDDETGEMLEPTEEELVARKVRYENAKFAWDQAYGTEVIHSEHNMGAFPNLSVADEVKKKYTDKITALHSSIYSADAEIAKLNDPEYLKKNNISEKEARIRIKKYEENIIEHHDKIIEQHQLLGELYNQSRTHMQGLENDTNNALVAERAGDDIVGAPVGGRKTTLTVAMTDDLKKLHDQNIIEMQTIDAKKAARLAKIKERSPEELSTIEKIFIGSKNDASLAEGKLEHLSSFDANTYFVSLASEGKLDNEDRLVTQFARLKEHHEQFMGDNSAAREYFTKIENSVKIQLSGKDPEWWKLLKTDLVRQDPVYNLINDGSSLSHMMNGLRSNAIANGQNPDTFFMSKTPSFVPTTVNIPRVLSVETTASKDQIRDAIFAAENKDNTIKVDAYEKFSFNGENINTDQVLRRAGVIGSEGPGLTTRSTRDSAFFLASEYNQINNHSINEAHDFKLDLESSTVIEAQDYVYKRMRKAFYDGQKIEKPTEHFSNMLKEYLKEQRTHIKIIMGTGEKRYGNAVIAGIDDHTDLMARDIESDDYYEGRPDDGTSLTSLENIKSAEDADDDSQESHLYDDTKFKERSTGNSSILAVEDDNLQSIHTEINQQPTVQKTDIDQLTSELAVLKSRKSTLLADKKRLMADFKNSSPSQRNSALRTINKQITEVNNQIEINKTKTTKLEILRTKKVASETDPTIVQKQINTNPSSRILSADSAEDMQMLESMHRLGLVKTYVKGATISDGSILTTNVAVSGTTLGKNNELEISIRPLDSTNISSESAIANFTGTKEIETPEEYTKVRNKASRSLTKDLIRTVGDPTGKRLVENNGTSTFINKDGKTTGQVGLERLNSIRDNKGSIYLLDTEYYRGNIYQAGYGKHDFATGRTNKKSVFIEINKETADSMKRFLVGEESSIEKGELKALKTGMLNTIKELNAQLKENVFTTNLKDEKNIEAILGFMSNQKEKLSRLSAEQQLILDKIAPITLTSFIKKRLLPGIAKTDAIANQNLEEAEFGTIERQLRNSRNSADLSLLEKVLALRDKSIDTMQARFSFDTIHTGLANYTAHQTHHAADDIGIVVDQIKQIGKAGPQNIQEGSFYVNKTTGHIYKPSGDMRIAKYSDKSGKYTHNMYEQDFSRISDDLAYENKNFRTFENITVSDVSESNLAANTIGSQFFRYETLEDAKTGRERVVEEKAARRTKSDPARKSNTLSDDVMYVKSDMRAAEILSSATSKEDIAKLVDRHNSFTINGILDPENKQQAQLIENYRNLPKNQNEIDKILTTLTSQQQNELNVANNTIRLLSGRTDSFSETALRNAEKVREDILNGVKNQLEIRDKMASLAERYGNGLGGVQNKAINEYTVQVTQLNKTLDKTLLSDDQYSRIVELRKQIDLAKVNAEHLGFLISPNNNIKTKTDLEIEKRALSKLDRIAFPERYSLSATGSQFLFNKEKIYDNAKSLFNTHLTGMMDSLLQKVNEGTIDAAGMNHIYSNYVTELRNAGIIRSSEILRGDVINDPTKNLVNHTIFTDSAKFSFNRLNVSSQEKFDASLEKNMLLLNGRMNQNIEDTKNQITKVITEKYGSSVQMRDALLKETIKVTDYHALTPQLDDVQTKKLNDITDNYKLAINAGKGSADPAAAPNINQLLANVTEDAEVIAEQKKVFKPTVSTVNNVQHSLLESNKSIVNVAAPQIESALNTGGMENAIRGIAESSAGMHNKFGAAGVAISALLIGGMMLVRPNLNTKENKQEPEKDNDFSIKDMLKNITKTYKAVDKFTKGIDDKILGKERKQQNEENEHNIPMHRVLEAPINAYKSVDNFAERMDIQIRGTVKKESGPDIIAQITHNVLNTVTKKTLGVDLDEKRESKNPDKYWARGLQSKL